MPKGQLLDLIVFGQLMLVALASIGWLFLHLRRSRQRNDELEARLALLAKRQATVYLERELINSDEAGTRLATSNQDAHVVMRFRRKWLEIEQRALREEGGTKSDTAVIEGLARPLINKLAAVAPLVMSPVSGAKRPRPCPSGSEPSHAKQLAHAKATIAQQKDLIASLREQLTQLENHSSADGLQPRARLATSEEARNHAESQLSSIERVEAGLRRADAGFAQANASLAKLQERTHSEAPSVDGATDGSVLILSSRDNTAELDAARSLVSDMEDSHRDSLKELSLMRDTNARQRKLILQLEQRNTLLTAGTQEMDASNTLLEHLQTQLREYDNCTATLELATEEMRAKIGQLNALIREAESRADPSSSSSTGVTDAMHPPQVTATLATSAHHLGLLASADSLEHGAPHLIAWLTELGLHAHVLLRSGTKQLWFSSVPAALDSRTKQLMQSVAGVPGKPWTHVSGGEIYIGRIVRLFVEERSDRLAELKSELETSLKVIDALFSSLLGPRANQESLEQTLKGVRKLAAGTAVHQRYLLEESSRIGDKLYSELHEYFGALTLSKVQRECIEGLVEDFRSELNLLSRAGKSVQHNLVLLAQAKEGSATTADASE